MINENCILIRCQLLVLACLVYVSIIDASVSNVRFCVLCLSELNCDIIMIQLAASLPHDTQTSFLLCELL